MQRLTQDGWRILPAHVDVALGGMSYTWGVQNEHFSAEWRHRLWMDGGRALAWAWLFLPGSLEWQAHPDHLDLLDEILDWFASTAERGDRQVSVRAGNLDARTGLERRGYSVDEQAPWMKLSLRELGEIEDPRLPAGFRLHTMADVEADVAARIAVHQASWRELGTRITEATYASVTRTWPYHRDLDLVVESPTGEYAAFALAWFDDENLVGEFEPVPIRGSAAKVLAAPSTSSACSSCAVRGKTAIVAARGDDAHPVPRHLYDSVGFTEISRGCRYVKRPG